VALLPSAIAVTPAHTPANYHLHRQQPPAPFFSYKKELAYLKEKCDAGADVIITQMFFGAALFCRFVDDCRAVGITCPIMPGIMLIQNFGGFKRMTSMCKSRVPADMMAEIDAIPHTSDAEHAKLIREFGTRQGIKLCRELIAAGHTGLHFYCLNLENVTYDVMREFGLLKE